MTRMKGWVPARSGARAILVVTTLMLATQRSARAQDSTTARRDGWMVGPLLGLAGAASGPGLAIVTLGAGVTRLVPNRPGLDFSIGTIPEAFLAGLVPIAFRVGPSIPLAMGPDAFFIPSAGFSAIALAGSPSGVAAWYWGAAAVAARGPAGLRAGVTWHARPGTHELIWIAEIGFMRVPLPRRTH
jgi:hypothetical protein